MSVPGSLCTTCELAAQAEALMVEAIARGQWPKAERFARISAFIAEQTRDNTTQPRDFAEEPSQRGIVEEGSP